MQIWHTFKHLSSTCCSPVWESLLWLCKAELMHHGEITEQMSSCSVEPWSVRTGGQNISIILARVRAIKPLTSNNYRGTCKGSTLQFSSSVLHRARMTWEKKTPAKTNYNYSHSWTCSAQQLQFPHDADSAHFGRRAFADPTQQLSYNMHARTQTHTECISHAD